MSLRAVPLRYIDADGYGYALQLIYYLMKSGIELREVPIEFAPRASGRSKLPKLQIATSAWDLASLVFDKYAKRSGDRALDVIPNQPCMKCGERVLAMQRDLPVFKCLHCGMVQALPGAAVG